MTHINNHIDYVEFTAPDLADVKTFYGNVFGWTFQEWGEEYISFSSAGLEGGFHRAPSPSNASSAISPSSTSGALIILYADDLEVTEKKVAAAGGEITARHDFPGGHRFHFCDPAGNVLGVWTLVEDE